MFLSPLLSLLVFFFKIIARNDFKNCLNEFLSSNLLLTEGSELVKNLVCGHRFDLAEQVDLSVESLGDW